MVLAPAGLDHPKAATQVVALAGEEALPLDEVDEHQAVEHQRGVPFAVGLLADSLDKG
jgi:hypothetical protein